MHSVKRSYHDIYELIKRGEDQQLDFKKTITDPSKIAKTLVAFANTEGGELVIGVDDFGELAPIDAAQERFVLLKAARAYCRPKIYIYFDSVRLREGEVLFAQVAKTKLGFHLARTETNEWLPFVRIKDQTVLSPDLMEIDRQDKHNLNPIQILSEDHGSLWQHLKKHDSITVKEYMRLMNISYHTADRSLKGLAEQGVIETYELNGLAHFSLM